MATHLVSRLSRILLAALLLAGLLLSIHRPASAAMLVPSFDVTGVKADQLVTVRTHDFPANTSFTVRMDVAGNMAIDGIVVSEFNSGLGGAFESTYRIPAELKGKKTLAIRFESEAGYYAFNWFNNKDLGSTGSGSPIPVTGGKPFLTIKGVEKNELITVEARNLPASTYFMVRVGPFYTFAREAVETQTFYSGKGGTVVFNVVLPDVVENVELVAVRIDGNGRYAYNAFTNVDSGVLLPDSTTPVGYQCSIVSTSPSVSLTRKLDFDAVWEVKNTGTKEWNLSSVDYKYVSGTKLHTHNSAYDLNKTVKPGEKIKIVVDMLAPNNLGWFTTNWALTQGSSTICNLPLTIRVR